MQPSHASQSALFHYNLMFSLIKAKEMIRTSALKKEFQLICRLIKAQNTVLTVVLKSCMIYSSSMGAANRGNTLS